MFESSIGHGPAGADLELLSAERESSNTTTHPWLSTMRCETTARIAPAAAFRKVSIKGG